jgi:antirestriction protein
MPFRNGKAFLLKGYIDVEAYARDLEMGGDVFTVEEGCQVHVFWGR